MQSKSEEMKVHQVIRGLQCNHMNCYKQEKKTGYMYTKEGFKEYVIDGFKTQGPQDFSCSINWKELDSAHGELILLCIWDGRELC